MPAEMRQFIALFNGAHYAQAESSARALLDRQPNDGVLWKALGISLLMQGKDALQVLQQATQLIPADAEAHRALGNARQDQGQLTAAVASYQHALKIKPDFAEAYDDLGTALRALGLRDEAVASYRRALQINPNFAEAHGNLGNALRELGQLNAAVASYRCALASKPELAEAHNNLGNALRELGQLDAAVASYRNALQIKSNYAEAHANLGNALRELGHLDAAVASYRQALEIRRDYAEAHCNLGHVLIELGQLAEAAASYQRALAFKSDYAEAYASLGILLRQRGRHDEAEAHCRRALEIDPKSAAALIVLAELHTDRGQFGAAEELFTRAIAIAPKSPEAWAGSCRCRKMTGNDASWLAAVEAIASQPLRPHQEINLRYALGKYFDDVQDFEKAFRSYQRASELSKRYRGTYDRQRQEQLTNRIIQHFDHAWLQRSGSGAPASARPVLIIGMPRSGTSLVEQILASHPDVFGAGELTFWDAGMAQYEAAFLSGASGATTLRKLGADYLQLLQGASTDALRVVDKMPANFLFLGLIHAALPNARIIHMRRNPIDTCLSAYFQHFATVYPYANDLEDLAHYYTEYFRLMQHWRSVLPQGAILDMPYEGLLDDQEAWSRRMIEFIGLPWHPRCMDFQQTNRTVTTASRWQVRQRISKSSSGRWHNYEKFVGPLRRLLQLA
jgi:tetratricopeptide (TPR) repeat protein